MSAPKDRSLATASSIIASSTMLVVTALLAAPILRIASFWPLSIVPRLDVISGGTGVWGAAWEPLSQGADIIQREALAALCGVVTDLVVASILIAALSLTLHTVSRILVSWRSHAIRCALGATLRHLALLVGRDLLRLAVLGCGIGAVLGAAALMALRLAWPALLVRTPFIIPAIVAGLAASLGVMALVMTIALVMLAALQREMVRTVAELHGEHVTQGRGMLFVQDTLAAIQLAALLVVTYGAALFLRNSSLLSTAPVSAAVSSASIATLTWPEDTTIRQRADGYRALLARLPDGAVVTSPDATLALGRRLGVLAVCFCHVGDFPKLYTTAEVRMIAVSPGAPVTGRTGGRGFTAADTLGAPPVAVLNQAARNELFPGVSPLGMRVQLGTEISGAHLIVGTTLTAAPRGLGNRGDEPLIAYVPLLQNPPTVAEIVAPDTVWDKIRALLTAQPDATTRAQPTLSAPRPLANRLHDFGAPLDWLGQLCVGLAGAASGVAAYSLAAVMHQIVRVRERDIAIRVALGAAPRDIRRWVTARSLTITATGVLTGISLARWLAMLMHERAGQSDANDIGLLGMMVVLFGGLGLLAAWLPARRAARVDPRAVWSETL